MHDALTTVVLVMATISALAGSLLAILRFTGKIGRGTGQGWQLGALVFSTAAAAVVFVYHAAVVHQDWLPVKAHVDGLTLIAAIFGAVLIFLQSRSRLPGSAVFGLPLLALILAWSICASAWTYAPFAAGPERLTRVWTGAHLLGVYAGTLIVGLAAIAGGMYLFAQRRLRRKAIAETGAMASLETIETFIIRMSALGFALLTLGLATGLVIVAAGPTDMGPGWWYSPKVVLSFVVWAIYAVVMSVRHATTFRGARAAWLSIVGLVLLLAIFAMTNIRAEARQAQQPQPVQDTAP